MNRPTKTASVLGAAVLAVSLSACGGDSSDYCDTLESVDDQLSGLSGAAMTDPEQMSEMAGAFQEVADVAPDDIAETWQGMADALSTMSEVDMEDPEAMADAASEFEDMDPTAMQGDIEANVQDECDMTLGES